MSSQIYKTKMVSLCVLQFSEEAQRKKALSKATSVETEIKLSPFAYLNKGLSAKLAKNYSDIII